MTCHIALVVEVSTLPRVYLINISTDLQTVTQSDLFAVWVSHQPSPQFVVSLQCQQVDDHDFLLDDGLADDDNFNRHALMRPVNSQPLSGDWSHDEHDGCYQTECQRHYGGTVQKR